MKIKYFLLFFICWISFNYAYSQCNGGNPTVDKPTGFNAGISIEANFNEARRWEETNLGLTPNCLGNMTAPPGGWNTLTQIEKALYILQSERVARQRLPYQGMETNLNTVAATHSQWQINNSKFSHTGDPALGTASNDGGAPCYAGYNGSSFGQRIAANPNLSAGGCSQSAGENIGVASGNQDIVSVTIYGMMYRDLNCCNWGHRINFLANYNNDYGPADTEGFIGIGIAQSTSYVWPFSTPCNTTTASIVTFNTYDPAGNATCNFNPITNGGGSGCQITAVTAGTPSACNPNNNTYTVAVTVTYASAPATGTLNINGQTFAITSSPQTQMITLTANGQPVNVTAQFSAEPSCDLTVNNLFTAPASCATIVCNTYNSTGAVTIPPAGAVTSTINVPVNGSLTDVNILNLNGTHTWVEDLTFTLTSPNNTTITLVSNECGSADNFNINFDDAGTAFSCANYNNGSTIQPEVALSGFNGQNANGNWILGVTDVVAPDAGNLAGWSIQVCGVFGGGGCPTDLPVNGNIASNTYAAINITSTGTVGSTSNVTFRAENSITLQPNFTVETGGQFTAEIGACATFVPENENAVARNNEELRVMFGQALTWIAPDYQATSEENIFLENTLSVAPNPFTNETTIFYTLPQNSEVTLEVFDMNGKKVNTIIQTNMQSMGQHQTTFRAEDLAKGIYYVHLRTNHQVMTQRIVLMK